jgi:hypothetical protein
LIIELDDPKNSGGFLDYWNPENQSWRSFSCQIEIAKLVKCSAEEAENLRGQYASHQLEVGARGGLWYRSQVTSVPRGRRGLELDDTFTTLSGGRALAENMALDRELILGTGGEGRDVDLEKIKGVTVQAIPWDERLPEGEIAVDALSKRVPEDQYLMVLPSLQNLFALMDKVEETGTPILQSFSVGDQYRELPSRYRRQMGLDLPDFLARVLPVKTVAVTGGDPFFPTGSDVAVIFETEKVDFVFSSLKTAVTAKAKAAGAESAGEEGAVGFENETRSFSCHLAKLNGAVVVSNSARQLERILAVEAGKVPALGETGEYRFFRHRYPIAAEESAYVFISDACLRSWAGPRVRIAASRRSRALAALGSLTSARISGEELSQKYEPLLGKVRLFGDRVFSERYGSLGFLTPIAELEIARVTSREKAAYERWRRGYEGGWAQFFDPIAIQLKLSKTKEELDMTILPLRVDSDYQEMIALAGEARLSNAAMTVPEESVFHAALAIDPKSRTFQQANVSLIDFLPALKVNPLGWIGSSASVTLGGSLAWQSRLEESLLEELPALLRVEVKSRLKLALFMTAMKAAIESSGPDLVSWETRKHGDRRYVAVTGDEGELGMDVSVYYATLPSALLISLNEEMLKRAIDREAVFEKGKSGTEQVIAEASTGFLIGMSEMAGSVTLEERRRRLSWNALPVLNEWYKSKSAIDPVAFHEVRFASRVTCPGGLGYRWNEKDLTMESVAFGHPSSPRDEAKDVEILDRFKTLAMSASFEDGGMNLKVSLDEASNFKWPSVESAPRPEDGKIILYSDLKLLPVGTVQIFETKYETEFEEDNETHRMEVRTESVEEIGDRKIIEDSIRSLTKEEGRDGRSRFEVGPKGSRSLSWDGEWKMNRDLESYDYPAEIWAGLAYRVRKNEIRIFDGVSETMISDHVVKVIGWEKIQGPGGEEVEALKIEQEITTLTSQYLERSSTADWLAPGYGTVKSEGRAKWGRSAMKLQKITKPE